MKSVAVPELRDHLVAHLRSVQAGEHILVTDHGAVVAELHPPGEDARRLPAFDTLLRLQRDGIVRVGSPKGPDTYLPSPLPRAVQSMDLLDAEREEG